MTDAPNFPVIQLEAAKSVDPQPGLLPFRPSPGWPLPILQDPPQMSPPHRGLSKPRKQSLFWPLRAPTGTLAVL